ncbi:MAG: hypothetical protein KAQ85_02600 [Thermodesulfovibrionia bacterium]|nr:hypothetical protein [Thermodesulfovibrionia bacterium]
MKTNKSFKGKKGLELISSVVLCDVCIWKEIGGPTCETFQDVESKIR